MTEQVQAAEAAQEVQTAAPEAAVSSQEQVQQRDFETEAREIGWVPEAEFKGPKEKWKPAQQFVEDGEKILPIVRSQLKRTQDELAKEKAEFAKRLERMERMSNTSIERLKAQHKADLDRIEAQKLAAVEAGDTVEYKRLDKQEKALAGVKFDDPAADDPQTVHDTWVAKNGWFKADFDAADKATRYSQWLATQNPNITLADNLAQTETYMRKEHPELFGGQKKPAANGHAAVDPGGDFPGAGRKEGPAAKLPAEARKQAEADVKNGLYKNVDDWAKVYFS